MCDNIHVGEIIHIMHTAIDANKIPQLAFKSARISKRVCRRSVGSNRRLGQASAICLTTQPRAVSCNGSALLGRQHRINGRLQRQSVLRISRCLRIVS